MLTHPLGIAVVGCCALLLVTTAALLWRSEDHKDKDDHDDPI